MCGKLGQASYTLFCWNNNKERYKMAEKVKELTPEQIAKAKEARNAYMREWRRKHKAAAQEACLKYWLRKAEAEEATGR